jgi:hypothetical protein
MIKDNDLRACIAALKVMLASDIEPVQKEALESVLKRVKQLGRKKNPTPAETFRAIREISAELTKHFRL